MNRSNTLIVGIGSPHGDDVAGWKVAERLISGIMSDIGCQSRSVSIKQASSPLQMIDWIDDVQRLILCDACRGIGRQGDVQQWTWPAQELVDMSWSGTHDFSLIASLQLAQRLKRLPPIVEIWTIAAADVISDDISDAMSPEVAAAVPRAAKSIARILAATSNAKGT